MLLWTAHIFLLPVGVVIDDKREGGLRDFLNIASFPLSCLDTKNRGMKGGGGLTPFASSLYVRITCHAEHSKDRNNQYNLAWNSQ